MADGPGIGYNQLEFRKGTEPDNVNGTVLVETEPGTLDPVEVIDGRLLGKRYGDKEAYAYHGYYVYKVADNRLTFAND